MRVRFRLFDAAGGNGPGVTRIHVWRQNIVLPQNLNPGDTITYTLDPTKSGVEFNACADSDNCTLSLVVDVDPNENVCECDVGDNRQIFDLPMEIPDLVVSMDSTPQIVCDDDPGPGDGFVRVAGDVIVENTGCGPVPAGTEVRVRFRLFDAAGGNGPGVTRIHVWRQRHCSTAKLESWRYNHLHTGSDKEWC